MLKLAVSKATSRLAVFKCLVAAEVAGIEVQAVASKKVALTLPNRVPALVDGASLELFGEHAIVQYLGTSKNALDNSIEGSDWVELDQRHAAKWETAPAAIEERLNTHSVGKYLGAPSKIGVADVCVGCTLAFAKENGIQLGPRSSSWLTQLSEGHPAFASGWAKSGMVAQDLMASYVAIRNTQRASVMRVLQEACGNALASFGPAGAATEPMIGEGNKKNQSGVPPEYQINNAMSLFKALGGADPSIKSPRDVAVQLQAALEAEKDVFGGEVVSKAEVAGPGFINVFLSESFVSQRVRTIIEEAKLLAPTTQPRKVGVDFSSPNVAKEMHVGHLRSTIIGEVLCRLLTFSGHEVKRINHIGDWGTQFGMLLTYMRHNHPNFLEEAPTISDLDAFYRQAKASFDASDDFKNEARQEVVRLQSGDEAALAGWRQFLRVSESMLFQVYDRLGVTFPDGLCGESFYNSRIPAVVNELESKGLLKVEDGAKCLFTEVFSVPLFVVKRDGGYGYDSTDLAAIKYRTSELGLDWLIYVVDNGQENHFLACFEASQRAGWVDGVRLDHVGFGVVCGEDRKRFRTRQGGTVRLVDLLDEACSRMVADLEARVAEGRSPLTREEIPEAAAKIGYSAVKYFDLKNSRERDYVFDYDAMLSSDGDTAVYLIYSYARICNIEARIRERVGIDPADIRTRALENFLLSREFPLEWELATQLLRFPEVLERCTDELRPHHLCAFTYNLATVFARFYTNHRIIVPVGEGAGASHRLDPDHGARWVSLVYAVKVALRDSFALLGIEPLERI